MSVYMQEHIEIYLGGRTLKLAVRTMDVATHAVLTKGGRWVYLSGAIRDALTRIAEEATRDPKEG